MQSFLVVPLSRDVARFYTVLSPFINRIRFCFFKNEIAMRNVTPTEILPGNSTQQRGSHSEQAYMPLKVITQSKKEKTSPNVEYAPLDIRTRSWEVAREDVNVDKIIGKGAFGQVAKGTVKNLPNGSATTRVAIKMLKGKVYLFKNSFS